MKIINLTKHNIKSLNAEIPVAHSMGIAGLSGSGKTTFCEVISDEYKRRMISLLPKADRDFLFKDLAKTDYGSLQLDDIPPTKFFHQDGVFFSPRSTIGTHSGVFKSLRRVFANRFNLSIQYFSYNNPTECNADLICRKCMGRGTFGGNTCVQCNGNRYTQKINDYSIVIGDSKYSLLSLFQMPVSKLLLLADQLNLPPKDKLLLTAFTRLELGYLSLDRTFGTLSGGEITRIQLAEAITCSHNNLIIIDELSHGLDSQSLDNVLQVVSDLGKDNVIWFIDHSDHVLDLTNDKMFFGPKSGNEGGKIIEYSPRPKQVFPESPFIKADSFFEFKNLNCRNINIPSMQFPRNCIVAISGKSGCGKSTLMRECILPYISRNLSSIKPLVVEQNKAKMVTKNSTIATFLGIAPNISQKAKVTKTICHVCSGTGLNDNGGYCSFCSGTGIDKKYFEAEYANHITVRDIYNQTIAELLNRLSKNDPIYNLLKDVDFLGISHLSLGRSIRTLSSGEYQALYLVSCLNSLQKDKNYFLFLDEPTKGLSQNIINQLMVALRKLQSDYNMTIVYIEHSSYMLQAADYIIDFGPNRLDNVSSLLCVSHNEWITNQNENATRLPVIPSKANKKHGIVSIQDYQKGNTDFNNAINQFYFSLRQFSDTANWIYSSYNAEEDSPTIAIDFAGTLYSRGTRAWELANVVSCLVQKVEKDFSSANLFDFRNPLNHCLSCKGTGIIKAIDFTKCFVNKNETWNSGLIEKDVYAALRNYNFSRVTKMFLALKKIRNIDLSKAYSAMTDEERNVFMYGDWNYKLPGKENRLYIWKGFNFLIQKYMKESSSPMKAVLKDSLQEMVCPVCHGRTLRHRETLEYCGKDIFDYLTMNLKDLIVLFPDLPRLKDIMMIVGENASLYHDISKLSKESQCFCKIYDLYSSGLVGFNIFFKNIPHDLPQYVKKWLSEISQENEINICSEIRNYTSTYSKLFPAYKCSDKTPLFQLLGYKNIDKELRSIKKQFKCPACNGKGTFAVTSDNDDINTLSEACSQCNGSGIAIAAQQQLISGISIEIWLSGNMHVLRPEKFPEGVFLPVFKKLSELDQGQLETLAKYL